MDRKRARRTRGNEFNNRNNHPIRAGIVIGTHNGTITVLKGNKPLCLRIHRQHRVVLYASDDAFIDFAVDFDSGWRELEVPPMTMLTIRHADVRAVENSEFRFIPQERKGTLPEGVNA